MATPTGRPLALVVEEAYDDILRHAVGATAAERHEDELVAIEAVAIPSAVLALQANSVETKSPFLLLARTYCSIRISTAPERDVLRILHLLLLGRRTAGHEGCSALAENFLTRCLRVPFAGGGSTKEPNGLENEQVLLLVPLDS